MAYAEALDLQRAAARARIAGTLPDDLLLLVEHPPVVTLGRTSKAAHLGVSAEYLAANGIELFDVERGGDVTFHGPGQLVGYPVFNLQGLKPDLHWYLRQVEEALIRTLALWGLDARRNPGHTGVWTAGKADALPALAEGAGGQPDAIGTGRADPALRKIASIGVHAREWVTWHGFALNVSTDLRYFDLMVPCGIPGVRMTSLEAELGEPVPPGPFRNDIVSAVQEVFGFSEVRVAEPERLLRTL